MIYLILELRKSYWGPNIAHIRLRFGTISIRKGAPSPVFHHNLVRKGILSFGRKEGLKLILKPLGLTCSLRLRGVQTKEQNLKAHLAITSYQQDK